MGKEVPAFPFNFLDAASRILPCRACLSCRLIPSFCCLWRRPSSLFLTSSGTAVKKKHNHPFWILVDLVSIYLNLQVKYRNQGLKEKILLVHDLNSIWFVCTATAAGGSFIPREVVFPDNGSSRYSSNSFGNHESKLRHSVERVLMLRASPSIACFPSPLC